MSQRSPIAIALVLTLAVGVAPMKAATGQPVAVSPGAVREVPTIDQRCPAFSWGAVEGARAYELVVYGLPPAEQGEARGELSDAEVGLEKAEPLLRERLPGGALSWTPSMARCLSPGGRYAWLVRSHGEEGASDWSEPRLFQVAAAPSAAEIEQALAVVQAYLAGGGVELGGDLGEVSPEDEPGAGERGASRARSEGGSEAVPMADVTAILGQVPDTTGVTFGLHGISASTDDDSAGVVGESTATSGATVGVLGEVDSAAGLAGAFDNTAGGQILSGRNNAVEVFSVGGAGVVTGSSFVGELNPADLSAGTAGIDITGTASNVTGTVAIAQGGTGATTAADAIINLGAATTAQLVAHTLSADHDGRYYTETEMATAGGGAALHWDNVTAVPPGFADGLDDDTTYTAGPGLVLNGSEFSLGTVPVFTPQSNSFTTLDTAGDVGTFTSVTIGADGVPLISYRDLTNGDLKAAHCADTVCSSASTATLDSGGFVGDHTSLTIGTDGLGLISYVDNTNGGLKVAHCTNTACSSATTTTLDAPFMLFSASVTIGSDGLGLISYYYSNPGGVRVLKVAHCSDVACSSATTATVDSSAGVGDHTSVTIGSDGLGLISYYDTTNGDLKAAHCANTACSSATTATLDSVGDVGKWTSVTVGVDGLGLISYYDVTNTGLKVAHCVDLACSSATVSTVDATGDVGQMNSVTVSADGLGLITYYDTTNGDLKVAHCANTACSSATTTTLESSGNVGWNTAVTIGADGNAFISYVDVGNHDLRVAHCASSFCVPFFRRR